MTSVDWPRCLECDRELDSFDRTYCSRQCSATHRSKTKTLQDKMYCRRGHLKVRAFSPTKDNYYYICKHCQRASQRAKAYGISMEEALAIDSNGICQICGEEDEMVVDHDHESGKVRGLICNGCNVGLGFFKDNISSLASAIVYLNR